ERIAKKGKLQSWYLYICPNISVVNVKVGRWVFQSIMSNREGRATRESNRVLDSAARFRRQKKALEALEQDNFQ
ncbi:unnamed protein product, partial [Allacma fusca]